MQVQNNQWDNWTPTDLKHVQSKRTSSIEGVLGFLLGPAVEKEGQPLSPKMIDEMAPYYATQFHVDEPFARNLLQQIRVYVGGSATGGAMAITEGTHIFVPDDSSLDEIMSYDHKRWLLHEIAHTFQAEVYLGGSQQQEASVYLHGLVVGHDTPRPGTGGGPLVWGSVFTGFRAAREHDVNSKKTESTADRALVTALPAGIIAGAATLGAGGAIDLQRTLAHNARVALGTATVAPSHKIAWALAAGTVGAPMAAGGLISLAAPGMSGGQSAAVGALAGASIAGVSALALGKRYLEGTHGASRTQSIAMLAGLVGLGAIEGWTMAGLGTRTAGGWSRSNDYIVHEDEHSFSPNNYQDALHDAHWLEIDAEGVARHFNHQGQNDTPAPTDPHQTLSGARMHYNAIKDWGGWNPVVLGGIGTGAAGLGILGVRTLNAVRTTRALTSADPIGTAGREALETLARTPGSLRRSMALASAFAVTPAVVGGLSGGLLDLSPLPPVASAGVASTFGGLAAGYQLSKLMPKGGAASDLVRHGTIGLGVVVGATVAGYFGLTAANAAHHTERRYSDSAN